MRMALRWAVYLLSLAVCTVFYTFYQGWISYILFLVMLGFPWLSLLISLPAILRFRLRVEAPEAVTRGTSIHTSLIGQSPLPLPMFTGRIRVRRVTDGETWSVPQQAVFDAEHCGTLELTAQRVWVFDYLGLIPIPVRQKVRTEVIVRPTEVKMRVPSGLEQLLARAWRPRPGGGYSEHHEMRLYRPGDSLNQIHWKLTAKAGKLIVREPMQPDRGAILLALELAGTAEELDRMFGRLLSFGKQLLERGISFEVSAATVKGQQAFTVTMEEDLIRAIDTLLCIEASKESVMTQAPTSRQIRIGGGVNDA